MSVFKSRLFFAICLLYSNAIVGQVDVEKTDLVNIDGLGDLQMVFEPGLKIKNEEVRKTFQPSFIGLLNAVPLRGCFCKDTKYLLQK